MLDMEIDTIDHVNVETDDVDRSAKFYREVIGLKEGPRPDFDRPGFWMYAGDKPVVHIIKTAPNNKMLTGSKDASIYFRAISTNPTSSKSIPMLYSDRQLLGFISRPSK